MTEAPQQPIAAHEWQFVQALLADAQAEEAREQLAELFGQWRLSIRAFRRVEAKRMTAGEPTSHDMLFHKASVSSLISMGSLLQVWMEEYTDKELAACHLRKDVVAAMVADLQNTFDEWHAQISEARVQSLSDRIFNASPELNLAHS